MAGATATAFNSSQFEAIYPEGVERHYWNRCRNQVILDALQRIGDPGQILEIGCGKGLVVAYLRSRGFLVTGVELADVRPTPGLQDHVRTNTNALALDPAERRGVKTILLLDVIEHLEDPSAFLKQLKGGFPSLQQLVITVPARQELFSNYDAFNGHYRRYDLPVLEVHMAGAGFRIVRASYFFHALYPAARALLMLSKARKEGFTVPAKGLPSTLHRLLSTLFLWEYKILPSAWPGSSIIANVEVQPGSDPRHG